MAICLKCGKTINLMGRECPYCHTPLTYTNVADSKPKDVSDIESDYKSNRILYKSIFIPYGIYVYLKNKDEFPLRASSALGGLMIGTIFLLFIIIIIMVAMIF